MFCITLALKDNPVVWTLMYKTEETASSIWHSYNIVDDPNLAVLLADDFGQIASIQKSRVAGAMFEDLDKSALAYVERILHNTRIKARADKMAASDTELRQSSLARGPALFDPTGMNGMHRS